MALSFGVTVLPDPPYSRMIELIQVAERTERVESLRARPLALRVLDVPRRHVVRRAITADMVERIVDWNPVPAAPDLDRQLGLGVDVRRLRWDDDRVAGADQRVLELAEEQRLGGRLVTQFGCVLGVVPPDANDLHALILTQ